MPVRDFALGLHRLGNGTTVLALAGEVDLYRGPEIEEALAQAIGPEWHRDLRGGPCGALSADGGEARSEEARSLTIDLRAVTFLDSTALALLLAASRRQRARGGELVVLVGPQTPMSAFEVTGLDELLSIRRGNVEQGARET